MANDARNLHVRVLHRPAAKCCLLADVKQQQQQHHRLRIHVQNQVRVLIKCARFSCVCVCARLRVRCALRRSRCGDQWCGCGPGAANRTNAVTLSAILSRRAASRRASYFKHPSERASAHDTIKRARAHYLSRGAHEHARICSAGRGRCASEFIVRTSDTRDAGTQARTPPPRKSQFNHRRRPTATTRTA